MVLLPDLHRILGFLHLKPAQLLVSSFFLTICLGTLLLLLPIATQSGEGTPFIDALFTATSAVCVTGLIVVDTPTYFSWFGQLVILVLIQIGGLGIMTLSASLALLLGKRISMRGKAVLQDYLDERDTEHLKEMVVSIIKMTLVFESIGALILAIHWHDQYQQWGKAIYYAIFHSISAFNNAGFALYTDSLYQFRTDPVISLTIALLIILGGLGFPVIFNLWSVIGRHHAPFPRLSLHSKIVLMTTVILLIGGTVSFFFAEYAGELKGLRWPEKILVAFFQAVTPRTAGFNTLNIGALTNLSLFITIILMFIGASPASTGGGVKTNSFALLILIIRTLVRGREDVEVFRRAIPMEVIHRALVIINLSFGIINLFTILLLITETAPFLSIFFEVVSAFGTVGLSMGLTPYLTVPGKCIIAVLMFIGRTGPLTLAFAVGTREKSAKYSYPLERVMVG